ncbi:MAG: preprotein translocase subunit SecY [Gammaproteobacteria bacterium]|nr:preprotein translocase subunit SecY [Gammaproteobacteria bacterium]
MATAASNLKTAKGLANEGSKHGELKKRIWFLILALIVYRIGTYIPVPGIDPLALEQLFNRDDGSGSMVDVLIMFSGGALERLSIFALGVMPYISASIIMQILTFVVPSLSDLRKEGESGRRTITKYTRYGTLALASFQSIGVSVAMQNQQGVVLNPGFNFVMMSAVTLVAGTMFLMWLGEQITERGIGNGISLLILAGIIAGLPTAIGGSLDLVSKGELSPVVAILLLVLVLGVLYFVVFMEMGQRRIAVNYAKRQQGRKVYQTPTQHLPYKLNSAGVIPPIFASSIILLPVTIAGWFGTNPDYGWLQDIAAQIGPGKPLYILMYAALIIFFCFFYTALQMNTKETADNLKRSGAFIPGIRPGRKTGEYLDTVLTRLTFWGALYVTAVCLLPEFMILQFNVPFYFGGTSLLIIVVVVMDFRAQLAAHLMTTQYQGLAKKANLKGYGRTGSPR